MMWASIGSFAVTKVHNQADFSFDLFLSDIFKRKPTMIQMMMNAYIFKNINSKADSIDNYYQIASKKKNYLH